MIVWSTDNGYFDDVETPTCYIWLWPYEYLWPALVFFFFLFLIWYPVKIRFCPSNCFLSFPFSLFCMTHRSRRVSWWDSMMPLLHRDGTSSSFPLLTSYAHKYRRENLWELNMALEPSFLLHLFYLLVVLLTSFIL